MNGVNFREFRHRDSWIKAVLCARLTNRQKVVLISIAMSSFMETGRCVVASETIAQHTRVNARHVRRVIHQVEALGWLEADRTAGRRSNTYRFAIPDSEANPGQDSPGCERDNDIQPGPREPRLPGPREPGLTRAVAAPHTASPTANSNSVYSRPNGREIKIESSRAPSGALENGFEEFWHAYPKKRKKADARAAYGKVLADGLATADELVAGAVAYAAAREGQDDNYTQHPANWLKGECWHDEHSPIQAARKRSNVEVALEGFLGGDSE